MPLDEWMAYYETLEIGSSVCVAVSVMHALNYLYDGPYPKNLTGKAKSRFFKHTPTITTRRNAWPSEEEILDLKRKYKHNIIAFLRSFNGHFANIPFIELSEHVFGFAPEFSTYEFPPASVPPSLINRIDRMYFFGSFGNRCVYESMKRAAQSGIAEKYVLVSGCIINSDLGTKGIDSRLNELAIEHKNIYVCVNPNKPSEIRSFP